MRERLIRFFSLQPEDCAPVVLLMSLIVPLSAIIASVKVVSNSLFVFHVGIASLPYVYIASAILLTVFGFYLKPLFSKMPIQVIYRASAISFAALFCVSFLLMRLNVGAVYFGAYVLATFADSLLFMLFGIVVNTLCDSKQSGRVFPLTLGGAMLGAVIGSFGTKFLLAFVRAPFLMIISAGILLVTLIPFRSIQKFMDAKEPNPAGSAKAPSAGKWQAMMADIQIVREFGPQRLLYYCFIVSALLACLTDFLFNVIVVWKFSLGGEIQAEPLTAFFALVDGATITVSLLVQFLLTSRILRVVGITNAQFFLPGVYSTGFGLILAGAIARQTAATFGCAVGTRIGQKFLSSTVHRTALAIVARSIADKKSISGKDILEGMVQQFGMCLAGCAIFFLRSIPLMYVALVSAVCGAAYLVLVIRLKKMYVAEVQVKEKSAAAS